MRSNHKAPAATGSALPAGQHAVALRRFGLPRSASRRSVPQGEPSLSIGGEVGLPMHVGWSELQAAVERRQHRADLHCVTTWSARDLLWGGLPFAEVLTVLTRLTEASPDARWLTLTGADGFRSCLLLEDARAEGVLLADELNGSPLPAAHGAPVRLVAPAHYGYKSVKHLTRIGFHSHYQGGTAGWAEHPRARASREERSRGLPGRVYRWTYRALLPLALRPYRTRPQDRP